MKPLTWRKLHIFSSAILRLSDRLFLGSLGQMILATRKLERVQREMQASESDRRINLPIDVIEKYVARDITRLERIEDKSKSNVFAASMGVSLLTAAMVLYGNDRPLAHLGAIAKSASIILFAWAVISSFLSAIMSLRAYRVGMVNYPDLDDRPPLCTEQETKRALLDCLDQNRPVVTSRANCLTVATNLLVNAVVVLAVFLLFVVGAVTVRPNSDSGISNPPGGKAAPTQVQPAPPGSDPEGQQKPGTAIRSRRKWLPARIQLLERGMEGRVSIVNFALGWVGQALVGKGGRVSITNYWPGSEADVISRSSVRRF